MLIESRTLIKLDPLHMFVSWSIRAICEQTETSPIIICIFFRCWPFGYFISIPIKRRRASFVSILVYDWSLIEDVLGHALFPHTLGSHLRFICSTLLLDYEKGETYTDKQDDYDGWYVNLRAVYDWRIKQFHKIIIM